MAKANHKRATHAAPATPAPATPASAPATPARGSVTAARWGACGKGKAGFTLTMPAMVKAMPLTTVITCCVAQNPKRGNSGPAFAAYFAGGPTVGATTTLGAYITALTKAGHGGANAAAGHVAWDLNHGYITVTVPELEQVAQAA